MDVTADDSLKPLETRYRGYRFRSRTEARWAVFFHHLGWAFEYEPEGFDLNGTWYLPDFWLPGLGAWLEVKGVAPTVDELGLATELATRSGKEVLVAVGAPSAARQLVLIEADGATSQEQDWRFMEDRRNAGDFWIESAIAARPIGIHKGRDHDRYPIWTSTLQSALENSRAARFA